MFSSSMALFLVVYKGRPPSKGFPTRTRLVLQLICTASMCSSKCLSAMLECPQFVHKKSLTLWSCWKAKCLSSFLLLFVLKSLQILHLCRHCRHSPPVCHHCVFSRASTNFLTRPDFRIDLTEESASPNSRQADLTEWFFANSVTLLLKAWLNLFSLKVLKGLPFLLSCNFKWFCRSELCLNA